MLAHLPSAARHETCNSGLLRHSCFCPVHAEQLVHDQLQRLTCFLAISAAAAASKAAPKAASKVARTAKRAGKEAETKAGGGGDLGGIAVAGVAAIAGLALVLGGGGDAPKQAAKQVCSCPLPHLTHVGITSCSIECNLKQLVLGLHIKKRLGPEDTSAVQCSAVLFCSTSRCSSCPATQVVLY